MSIQSPCFPVVNGNLRLAIASFPSSTLRSGQRISGNGAWIPKRGRVYVKSEANTDEETSSSSSESTTSGNASIFSSVLCPLLKLFSVSSPFKLSAHQSVSFSVLTIRSLFFSLDCCFQGGDPSQQRNHALEVTPTTLFMYQNVCLRSKIEFTGSVKPFWLWFTRNHRVFLNLLSGPVLIWLWTVFVSNDLHEKKLFFLMVGMYSGRYFFFSIYCKTSMGISSIIHEYRCFF